jgi:hypothetical protein
MAVWNILWIFGIFNDHLVNFVFIWYIFSGFGIMYQEKSGNPGWDKIFDVSLHDFSDLTQLDTGWIQTRDP